MGCMVRKSNLSGGKIFQALQTGPKAHPASSTMGTGSFPWAKLLECGAHHQLLLVPGCKWVGDLSPPPLCAHRHVILANSSKDTKQHLILNNCKPITDRLSIFPTYYRNHRQVTVNQFVFYLVPV